MQTLEGRAEVIDRLSTVIDRARSGRGAAAVLRGEAGIGKSALLEIAGTAQGVTVLRHQGVRSEQTMPYAGLQLLCTTIGADLTALERPQAAAMAKAFGRAEGYADAFLVGLATVQLLTAAGPALLLVDDAQWLDSETAATLAFVLRRLGEHPLSVLAATRAAGDDSFSEFPALRLAGLNDTDARTLLQTASFGRVDDVVLGRIVAEARGNPRTLFAAAAELRSPEFAAGYGIAVTPTTLSVELAADQRLMLVLAAADPTGDPVLLRSAADALGIDRRVAGELADERRLRLGSYVVFPDPAERAAIYRSATSVERNAVHRALADATDPVRCAERRTWHLACASTGPDDILANELESHASHVRNRLGPAGAAAFLARSAVLTNNARLRAQRALAAADAHFDAGSATNCAQMLIMARLAHLDERGRAEADHQQARLTFFANRNGQAAEQLLHTAQAFKPPADGAAVDALVAAICAGRFGPGADTIADKLSTDAATADLGQRWLWLTSWSAADAWDDGRWKQLAEQAIEHARETGSLMSLPFALTSACLAELHLGNFNQAERLAERIGAVGTAMQAPPFTCAALLLAAWRGDEGAAVEQISPARRTAQQRGEGFVVTTAALSEAVLYNGLGRYDVALAAAHDAAVHGELVTSGWALVELIEAAARTGQTEAATSALAELTERSQLAGTDWALGIEARSRALLTTGAEAEPLYQEAVARLSRSTIRVHLARAQLLYGEWLRRQGRRVDARTQLRAARDDLAAIGATAFAERAHREHLATGEKVRQVAGSPLTPQEDQITALAREGLTNPEIGERLHLSPRTVEYHLHKVFEKLGVSSRRDLVLRSGRSTPS